MTAFALSAPLPYYLGRDGKLLNGGKLTFGEADKDPDTHPTTVYWDENLSLVAQQPVMTWNGMAVRDGTPAQLFSSGDVSVRVRDSANRQVLFAPSHLAANVAMQLVGSADPEAGAGLIDFSVAVPYRPGSLGAAVRDLMRSNLMAAGRSFYTATVYRQQSSAPTAPIGGIFDFQNKTLQPPDGWTTTPPTISTTPTWAAQFVFSTNTANSQQLGGAWSDPIVDAVAGVPNAGGTAELYRNTIEVFLQSATQPATPSGGAYTFSGDTFTAPAGGWSRTQPAMTTTPTYRSQYTFSSASATSAISAGGWSLPIPVAQDGAAGMTFHTATIYKQQSTAPTPPTGGNYNFSTSTLTPPATWLIAPPAPVSGQSIWACQFTFSTNTPSVAALGGTWSVPVSQSAGSSGTPGTPGAPGQRGSVEASAATAGTAWSNTEAAAAIAAAGYGTPVNLDRVTLFNSAQSYVETRYWNGVTWVPFQTLINGNLLVLGSIAGTALAVGSITTDRIQVGAASSQNVSAVVGQTFALNPSASVRTVVPVNDVPIALSGGDIVWAGHVNVRIDSNAVPAGVDSFSVAVMPLIDGTANGSAPSTANHKRATRGSGTFSGLHASQTFFLAGKPSTGNHTLRLTVTVEFHDVNGNPIAFADVAGQGVCDAYYWVSENKV